MSNKLLTGMVGLTPNERPDPLIGEKCAILSGDYEKTVRRDLEAIAPGMYESLVQQAKEILGPTASKPIIARFMARKLVDQRVVPATIKALLDKVHAMAVPATSGSEEVIFSDASSDQDSLEDDIPF